MARCQEMFELLSICQDLTKSVNLLLSDFNNHLPKIIDNFACSSGNNDVNLFTNQREVTETSHFACLWRLLFFCLFL